LGAVLLVALVIVSLLGWFPSLGGSTREQQSSSYWMGATPFSITTKLDNSTSIVLTLANRGSDRLNLTKIEFSDSVGTSSFTVFNGTVMTVSPAVYGLTFNTGGEATVYNTSVPDTKPYNQCSGSASGTVFDYKTVTFTYNQGSLQGIKQTGARPLVGRCS
jgi:hypothetical protein